MAYTLKLNVYNFSLYQIIGEDRRIVRGEERVKYLLEDDAVLFPDFVRTWQPNVDRNSFLPLIFQAMVTFFDSRFKVNVEGTKAVSITADPQPRIASLSYTKLNVYNFSLYQIIGEDRRIVRGEERVKYLLEDDAVLFPDFVRTWQPNVDRNSFLPLIFQAMVTFFDSRFKVNVEGTKAVSITADPQPRIASLSYTIDGLFKGGDTGIGRTIYDQQNATQPGTRIQRTDVPVNNYYYKLWMPYDGEDGILMIQSYTDMGCTATFRDQIEAFFISKGFKPKWNSMIPSNFIDQYLSRSFINEIKIVYQTETRDVDGIFSSMRQARKESWLKNLSIPLRRLLQLDNYEEQLQEKIMETVDYNPERDLAKVFYEDENGKKASATINNLESIFPNIILPDELKNADTDEPDLEATAQFTDGLLEQIKTDIGYNVAPIA